MFPKNINMIKASNQLGPLMGPLTVQLGLWCRTSERKKILIEYRRENTESKATGDFNEFQRVYRLFLFVVLRLTRGVFSEAPRCYQGKQRMDGGEHLVVGWLIIKE
jgi:hypothetical protein